MSIASAERELHPGDKVVTREGKGIIESIHTNTDSHGTVVYYLVQIPHYARVFYWPDEIRVIDD